MPQPAAKQFSGIFVCYRRDDSSGHAGRLFDKLVDQFGEDRIFMDIDTIEPGEDFVTVIENAVGSCEILIAIIGRDWLSSAGKTSRLLDNPNDFVRVEIAAALKRDIRVIPVLVQRATMPKPQDLPDDLARLSRRNAVELSDLRWHNDVDQLISVMERILAKREEARRLAETARQAEEERQRLEEEERRRAEEETQLRLAEEEAKLRTAEKRRQEEEERESSEAETRAKHEAQEASRQRVEEEHVRETEARRRVEQEAERRRAELERKAERRLEEEKQARAEKERIRREAEGLHEGRSKRTMLLVIIGCVTVLAIVALIWIRQTPEGEQHPTSPNATPTSPQQTGQTTSAPPTTAMPQTPPGMVYVAGGEFTMGRDDGDENNVNERPAHRVSVGGFFIDQHEVTCDEYAKFVQTGHPAPPDWMSGKVPKDAGRKPVTNVKWDDADAYCNKYGKRLPREEEWELAARGTKGYIYPWGKRWQAGLANVHTKGLAEVGKSGLSPYGAVDMVGNAWEWTASPLTPYPNGTLSEQPAADWKVIRGGSYFDSPNQATTTYRVGYPERDASDYSKIGFRCVSDIPHTSKAAVR